jgi:hypothetical protein
MFCGQAMSITMDIWNLIKIKAVIVLLAMLLTTVHMCMISIDDYAHDAYIPKRYRWNKIASITEWVKAWLKSTIVWIDSKVIVKCKPRRGKYQSMHPRAKRWRRSTKIAKILIILATTSLSQDLLTQFGTDAYDIGIDNRCSACVSHKQSDFIDMPTRVLLEIE